MPILVAVLVIVVVLFLIGGVVAGFVVWKRQMPKKPPASGVNTKVELPASTSSGFRWKYVLLPLVLFLCTVVSSVYFYPLLPARVGYHFGSNGLPDAWVSKAGLVELTVVLQFILTVAAAAIGFIVTKIGVFLKAGEVSISAISGVIVVMSNMVALPQILVLFVLLDIFSYNAYGVHFLSPTILAALIIVLGGFVLLFFFYRAMQQTRTTK